MKPKKPDTDYLIDRLQVLDALSAKAKLWIGNDRGPRPPTMGKRITSFTPFGQFKWRLWTPLYQDIHVCVGQDYRDPDCKGFRIDSLEHAKVESHSKAWLDKLIPGVAKR